MRAEDGSRRSSLVGQRQQHRGENSGCVERKEEQRKPNKSYLEAVKYGPNKREYSVAGDLTEGGRKVDQIFDQKSVLGEWSSEENNNDFLKKCVVGRVFSIDHLEAIKKLCADIWFGCRVKYLGEEEDSSFLSFMEDQSSEQEEVGIDSSDENSDQPFESEDDGVSETEWGEESRFGEDEGRSVNGGKSVEHINGGYEFHEETMELNEEERILNGKSEIEKNMVGQVNKEYMMESQAHSEKGGESNSGLFGEVSRVQQVGPEGNLKCIQQAGTEKEGIEVEKENSTNSVAGKDKSGLEEMGNNKEIMDNNSSFESTG
ncbi:hypothetical protein L6452_28369 [Arctium lappa]|uniref:Uncharacterized protein n=1 Tax=Arctium lappa TaxID=4217 RepID=A0ACB8ZY27_ARCLA|nr:hypothetical protein L6452_28369 [Arctium lappa]